MSADCRSFEKAIAAAARCAQDLESLSKSTGIPSEQMRASWRAVNRFRRLQGRALPSLSAEPSAASSGAAETRDWYAPTWRLMQGLERFQMNESLAAHYAHGLLDPEGGHYELNLAAAEVVAAARADFGMQGTSARLECVCVQAYEPVSRIEVLVSNAGRMLLDVERYREEPLSGPFIESLYDALCKGAPAPAARSRNEARPRELRTARLAEFCVAIEGDHPLTASLAALRHFRTLRPFPQGNCMLAYLLHFIMLHRAGYHFSAHVPVLKQLYPDDENRIAGRCLGGRPEDYAVSCDGFTDWTRYFENAVELLVDEQRWTMTKIEGIRRRRERFRAIIDADESFNYRQKEVLLEALLHSNAEFTYAIHEKRYAVSYPCARADFSRLISMGLLRQHDDGTRHFFVASDDYVAAFLDYLKAHCPQEFGRYYQEDGRLREEWRNTEDAPAEYNRDVGFYEKALLDNNYVEHYDCRRARIALDDGPRRRRPTNR